MGDALAVLLGGIVSWLLMTALCGTSGWGGLMGWWTRRKVARRLAAIAEQEPGRG